MAERHGLLRRCAATVRSQAATERSGLLPAQISQAEAQRDRLHFSATAIDKHAAGCPLKHANFTMGEDGRIKVAAARRARANGDDEADDEDEEDDDSPIGETTPRPHRRQRSS